MFKRICVLYLCFFAAIGLYGQAAGTGFYPFSAFDSKGFDSINLGNLNTHFEIPIVAKQGRGLPFNYSLVYDGLMWSPKTASGVTTWQQSPGAGFHGQLNGAGIVGYITNDVLLGHCQVPPYYGNVYDEHDTNFTYHDPVGAGHVFNYSIYRPCPVDSNGNPTNAPPQYSGDGSTADGSGYTYNQNTAGVIARNGAVINAPSTPSASGTFTDPNGNRISNNGSGVFTDTTGTSELTIAGSGSASSPTTFTYPVVNQASGATTATVTVSYAAYTVQTGFACPGIGESGATTVALVDHITLPDNTSDIYRFTYEATPGHTGSVTGRVKSITLPTGGIISYGYSGGCSGSGIMSDGSTAGLTRTTSDGIKTYSRATVSSNATTTTTTDEASNVSVFHFSQDATEKTYYETHRQVYQGTNTSGGNLLDQYSCYNGSSGSCDGVSIALPITSKVITTSYNNQAQVVTTESYSSGLLTSSVVSTPGGPTLESSSIQRNALGEVVSQTTSDPSGASVSSISYGYDETAPITTSNLPQHFTAASQRGNLTSSTVTTAINVTLRTTYTNDDAGQVRSIVAPNGTTSVSYDSTDTFETSRILPRPSSGINLATSASYSAAAGLPLNATGVNPGQTITGSTYDALLRPTTLTLPIQGAATNWNYTPNQTSVSSVISGTQSSQQITTMDSYGRPIRNAVWNGSVYYITDTCYGPTGMLQSVGLAYASSTLPSSYSCTNRDTYTYDALSRPLSVQHADGSSTSWTYHSFAVKQVDSPGATRITEYDMLGRISSVCEISSNTSMPGSGSPTACGTEIAGTGFITSYTYSLASHTTSVSQGAQTRTFQTDMAGRMIASTEPERGATQYSYTYNSTGLVVTRKRPKANQASTSVLTTTTTQLDSLDRPVSVFYDDGTPTKTFGYDAAFSPWSGSTPQTNLVGQLSYVKRITPAGTTETLFSYDLDGNIIANDQCQPSGCATTPVRHQAISYAYDLTDTLISEGDGTGTTYTFGRSEAGEITGITASPSDATHLANIIVPGSVQNGPFGPTLYSLGNGLNQVNTFDSMGRLNGGYTCGNSTAVSCSGGTQFYGFSITHQGQQLQASSDTVLNRGSSYGYDEFNRLTSSSTNAGTVQNLSWTYDRWGNRLQQNAPQGGPQPQLTFNTSTNQVIGDSYDAAGNVLSDGVHHYTYDADNNVISVDNGTTAVYTYDALNKRVAVNIPARGITEFAFDASGNRVSTWNAPTGSLNEGNVYWDGRPVAFKAGGSTHFEHQDWQGTERLRTSYNGTVESNYVSLPFGDGYHASGNDWDWYHFGHLTHDPDSGTEAATFRQYSSLQGRWMSADPYDGSYDTSNPQSLNRYSYVANDPLDFDDPDGYDNADGPSDTDPVPSPDGGVSQADSDRYTIYALGTTTQIPDQQPGPAAVAPTVKPGPTGGAGSTGSGSGGSTPASLPAMRKCTGVGRGLAGNMKLVGKKGGIAGQKVKPGTAAVIPSQFGFPSGYALSPFAPYIHGTVGNASFSSVTDVMGGKSPIPGVNVRVAMQQKFPGQLILEIPGAKDQGANAPVTVYVPKSAACPTGTK